LADAAQHITQDLISALQNPSPAAPFHPMGDAQLIAFRQLVAILCTSTTCLRVPTALPPPKQHAASTNIPIPTHTTPNTSLAKLSESPKDIIFNMDHYANTVINPDTGKSMEY
jgi:hypothetical protein